LLAVLATALIHGLLYVFLVPPWQHYDEPTHFEYAWLIANRLQLPQEGDQDATMRRETMRSMVRHGFYTHNNLGPPPDVDALPDDQLNLYLSQLDDPPGYYLFAALPLVLARNADITTQLYLNRIASLLLLLVCVVIAWAAVREVTTETSPLRWAVPLSIALLPAYVDIMTAANNDAGANTAFAAFLWVSLVCIKRGLSLPRFIALIGLCGVCFFIKRTVAIAIVIAPLVVLFAVLRGRRAKIAWAALGLGVAALLVGLYAWGDAAAWYRGTQQLTTTRDAAPDAIDASINLGPTAFRLDVIAGQPPPSVLQLIPPNEANAWGDTVVTLGAWIWATQPATVSLPVLFVQGGSQRFLHQAQVDATPSFHAFTITLPTQPSRTWVTLTPFDQPTSAPMTVFYDGVVLMEGQAAISEPPRFDNASAQTGRWGDRPFFNRVRNASAEDAWPYMQPFWTALPPMNRTREFVPYNLTVSPLDPVGAGWYFGAAVENIVRTFWSAAGWGGVRLSDAWYAGLTLVTAAGLIGGLWVASALRLRKWLFWTALGVVGLATASIIGLTFLRGIHSLLYTVFIPGARYLFPAIWPIMLLLVAGWREVARGVRAVVVSFGAADGWRWDVVGSVVFISLFVALDVAALFRIVTFYG
jgi:hypothetical protein